MKPIVKGSQYSHGPVVSVQEDIRCLPTRPDGGANRHQPLYPENGHDPGAGANGRGGGANRRRRRGDLLTGSPVRGGVRVKTGAQRLQRFGHGARGGWSEALSAGTGMCPTASVCHLRSS